MSENLNIEWLTKSPSMLSFFNNKKDIQLTGGTLYEIEAIKALKKTYNVEVNTHFIKNENAILYYLKNHKKYIRGQVCVLDPYVLAFGKFDQSKYNIAIIHHIDYEIANSSFFAKQFFSRMLANLKKMNQVVVVSQYWKEYLTSKGVKNIHIIYNSYPIDDYTFSAEESKKIKEKLGLVSDKPLVYLGKNSKGKGVDAVLDNINTTKYNLVVSGKAKHPSPNVKTIYFLNEEFHKFLTATDVVLAMSTMPEGWNRIAHEALLVKTPVIGSGSGGMKELLLKGGQKVVTDLSKLEKEIDYCINNSKELGEKGHDYVKQFNMNYFQSEWYNVVKQGLV